MHNLSKSLLLTISLVISCGKFDGSTLTQPLSKEENNDFQSLNLANIEKFSSCDEIKTYIDSTNAKYKSVSYVPESAKVNDLSTSTAKTPSSDILTNNQEANVEEADYIKIAEHYIFVLIDSEIKIINRESWSEITSISQSDLYNIFLYTDEDKLIVIGNHMISYQLVVRIYHTPKENLPTLLSEIVLNGNLKNSRLVNHHLIITAIDYNFQNSFLGGQSNDLGCEDVVKPFIMNDNFSVTKLFSIPLQDTSNPINKLALMGANEYLYMNENTIYLTQTYYNYSSHTKTNDKTDQIQTILAKVTFNKDLGDLELTATGVISGYIKDVWAFKALAQDDLLALATTTGELWATDENFSKNHLWVIGQTANKLAPVGSLENFGHHENIRAIRYIGNIAYIVTFKKTDPLFAIDLSDPYHPYILDELKIPGFSLYMHPLNNNKLIGVGFDTIDSGDFALYQGIKLSLFDISDSSNLIEVDTKYLGERGSISQIIYDHHAFFYDPKSEIIAIPVNIIENKQIRTFSGAILYQIKDSTLHEIARISHDHLISDSCKILMNQPSFGQGPLFYDFDINRIFKIDGSYIFASKSGLSAIDNISKTILKALKFSLPQNQCKNDYFYVE